MFSFLKPKSRNLFTTCLVSGLLLIGLLIGYFIFSLRPSFEGSNYSNFRVSEGDSLKIIARDLEDADLIRSSTAFKIYALISGSAHSLKPGIYSLSPASTTPQIINQLVFPARDVLAVIVEGETVLDIDEKLSSLGILAKDELSNYKWRTLEKDYPFLKEAKSLEGYLFPDSYRFFYYSSPEAVIRKFLDNFYLKTKIFYQNRSPDEFRKGLIMASLIEKEVSLNQDRLLVSGILWKRLKAGMPLQVDAAICYAKSKTFNDCAYLFKQDFNIDSPYNTYKYYGLPPGPIANPGLDAVIASFNPQSSAYWYYLSDPKTTKTIFAETLDKHNSNRVYYLDTYR